MTERSHLPPSILAVAALLLAAGCHRPPMNDGLPRPFGNAGRSIPQNVSRDVDLLFVIHDTGWGPSVQARLAADLPALIQRLRAAPGGLPDLHVGVTSTDLGTGPYPIPFCSADGEGGRLLRSDCTALAAGQAYLVDVEARGCVIDRTPDGCAASTCTQADCDAREPGSTLGSDERGCPRCRNYAGETLEAVVGCLVGLGGTGCGWEQPLEAMVRALDANPSNAGFLREDALLGVVTVTAEDDCSASDPRLFDTSDLTVDSELGFYHEFRCFEFGVTCQPTDDRHVLGPRTDCRPRDDPGALLHPIARYVTFLEGLKDPQQLVVVAIAAPSNGRSVNVTLGENEEPRLDASCASPYAAGWPGIRMAAFVEAFNAPEDLAWANLSVCADDYTPALDGIGRRIGETLGPQCQEGPFAGCADPAVEHGLPGDGRPCNDVCTATCQVEEIQERGLPSEVKAWVPPCLEVCATGPCPGNPDRALAYRAGHPDPRDPDLPVEVCWHIGYQPACSKSRFGELRLARRQDPPPRTFAEARCWLLPTREQLCHDGEDDNEDCLTDAEDPDCQ